MDSFNLKIDGEGVSPESVELGDLLETLASMRTAIVGAAVGQGVERQDVFLSLQRVEKKCNLLTLRENPGARAGRLRVSQAIRHRDLSLVPPESQKALRRLWSKASQRSWTIALQNAEPEAIIDPSQAVPKERYVTGKTSIFAYIERAGGTMGHLSVQVVLPNHERRTFPVANASVVVQLGERLMQHAVLYGTAKWFRGTQQLANFRVTRVGGFRSKTVNQKDALADVSKIMGHNWIGVDADAYLREERADD